MESNRSFLLPAVYPNRSAGCCWDHPYMDTSEANVHVVAVIHAAIFVLTLTGNIVVIIMVYRTKALHNAAYCYLVTLALCDMLTTFSAVPETILLPLFGARWLPTGFGCTTTKLCLFSGRNLGMLIVGAFSAERYMAVCRPFVAHEICTILRASKIVGACCLLSVLQSCLWFILTDDPIVVDESRVTATYCVQQLGEQTASSKSFLCLDMVLFSVMPVVFICTSYFFVAKTLCTLHDHHVRRRNAFHDDTPSLTCTSGSCHVRLTRYTRRQRKVQKQVHAVTLVGVAAILPVAAIPMRGILVYNAFGCSSESSSWFLLLAQSAVYVSYALHPVIYNIPNRRFRRAISDFFQVKQKTVRPSPRSATFTSTVATGAYDTEIAHRLPSILRDSLL